MSNGQLQASVQRMYTTGFQGQIVRGGPMRGKVARIASATVGTDPGLSTNRMSRAFGYTADISIPGGVTIAADADSVSVGGPDFYGILGHPERYALYGAAGNSLSPSIDLPIGAEGEFFDMVTGMIVEVFNFANAVQTINFGDQLAYVSDAITTEENPYALPYGALVVVAAGASAAAGLVLIPNARVQKATSLAASAAGAPVSGLTTVQLTQ